MNEQIHRGQQWLEELLELMGVPARATVANPDASEGESGWLVIDESPLSDDQIEDLIGDRGKTIDALQYLANTLLNIGVERELQQPFTIELNSYRIKREAELQAMVADVARQVQETGQSMEINSLSSAERRQVHSLFKDYTNLATESQGAEPNRRLIVRLA